MNLGLNLVISYILISHTHGHLNTYSTVIDFYNCKAV